jgi:hypothetical protein
MVPEDNRQVHITVFCGRTLGKRAKTDSLLQLFSGSRAVKLFVFEKAVGRDRRLDKKFLFVL